MSGYELKKLIYKTNKYKYSQLKKQLNMYGGGDSPVEPISADGAPATDIHVVEVKTAAELNKDAKDKTEDIINIAMVKFKEFLFEKFEYDLLTKIPTFEELEVMLPPQSEQHSRLPHELNNACIINKTLCL